MTRNRPHQNLSSLNFLFLRTNNTYMYFFCVFGILCVSLLDHFQWAVRQSGSAVRYVIFLPWCILGRGDSGSRRPWVPGIFHLNKFMFSLFRNLLGRPPEQTDDLSSFALDQCNFASSFTKVEGSIDKQRSDNKWLIKFFFPFEESDSTFASWINMRFLHRIPKIFFLFFHKWISSLVLTMFKHLFI